MSTPTSCPRIGIYGTDAVDLSEKRGCALWPAGYAAAVTEAGGAPVALELPRPGSDWEDALEGIEGVLFLGNGPATGWRATQEERLCRWCQERGLPLLAVDYGMHVVNVAFGGTLHVDLAHEVPNALQHQHSPEKGDRHAIIAVDGTRISNFYGEGEIVVNSEHKSAVAKLARDFTVSGKALDGVVEAIEADAEWFALGVQWHPASATASGLDIQLFRGLVNACRERWAKVLATCAA